MINRPPSPPVPEDDDALAEWLADRLVEAAREPGPLRLRALQAAGLVPEDGDISQDQIARGLGMRQQSVCQFERVGIAKMRRQLLPLFNETETKKQ